LIRDGSDIRCPIERPTDPPPELLIDREEDRTLRAVIVGMLREADLSH
jgi:hypothetical protein